MIDSHCHLHYDPYKDDRCEVIERAIACGVNQFILPGTDAATHNDLIELTKKYPNVCFATVGVHPTVVNDSENYQSEIETVEKLLIEKPVKFVAVGEIGLDYYWSKDFVNQQKDAFVKQLELAKKHNLPVIIHTRDAWDDTLDIMNGYQDIKAVYHCFSGTQKEWQVLKNMPNAYIGLNATATYKKYASLDVLPEIPLNRILVETDAPYLSPAPHRGKRNEPSYIPLFVPYLSDIYKVSVEQFDKITTFNTHSFFDIK